jgi:hypothetical protein
MFVNKKNSTITLLVIGGSNYILSLYHIDNVEHNPTLQNHLVCKYVLTYISYIEHLSNQLNPPIHI